MDVTTIQNNECFLFFPFSLKTKKCQYDFFSDYLTNNKNWYRENIDSGIFYEYISRRFGTGEHIKKCNVFSLNKDNDFITAYSKDIYNITEPIRFGKEVYKVYNFKIKGIKIITFDDAVFFLVFQINFLTEEESINTKILANTLYFLKKTTKTKIEQQSNEKQLTLSEFAYEIIESQLKKISKKIKAKMFFHIAEENARANFFLMANISINIEDEDCVNELYFLKNAFCDEYRNFG